MTIAVVTNGPTSVSSSARQARWSLSARSAVATSGPVSTISTYSRPNPSASNSSASAAETPVVDSPRAANARTRRTPA